MIFKLKHIISALTLACCIAIGTYIRSYFFDTTPPNLDFVGIEQDRYYAGEINCAIATDKRGDLCVWLDETPLIQHFALPNSKQKYPFSIPTRSIANGKHTLSIELTDNTFYKHKTKTTKDFYVDNVPLQAAFVKPDADYKVFQGRTLHIQFQANKDIEKAHVRALATQYDCYPESKNSSIYECFIPIPCEETPNEYLFSVEVADRVGNQLTLDNKFQIVMFPFKKSVLTVDAAYVMAEREKGLSHQELETRLEQLAQASPKTKMWRGTFCVPIEIQRTTTEFGTLRTTQERGRYMHKALDVVNVPRSVVWATQDGVVVLKERFELSGNTIVIDHGCGILSLFYHLEDFANVEVGQKVAKGNPIGTLGKTGYAKGYHLHWEQRVNNIAVDPMQWTKETF